MKIWNPRYCWNRPTWHSALHTHHTHIGQSQSLSQVKRTSQAKHTCMQSGQKSSIQHAQGIGYCGDGGKDQQGDAHQAWTSKQFRPLPWYRCWMGGGASPGGPPIRIVLTCVSKNSQKRVLFSSSSQALIWADQRKRCHSEIRVLIHCFSYWYSMHKS